MKINSFYYLIFCIFLVLGGYFFLSSVPLLIFLLLVLGSAFLAVFVNKLSVLEFLGGGVVFSEIIFLLAASLNLILPIKFPWVLTIIFLSFSILTGSYFYRFQRKLEIKPRLSDLAIILVFVLVFSGAYLVLQKNGYHPKDSEKGYVAYSFFNGDTFTLFALTKLSQYTGKFPRTSPFEAHASLEYPALFPYTLGRIFNWLQLDVTSDLLFPFYLQIFATIASFFLLARLIFQEKQKHIIFTLLTVIYLLFLSWDSFIYPQVHFFLMSLFLVLVLFFTKIDLDKNLLWFIPAFFLVNILFFSNKVLGLAAVILFMVFSFYYLCQRQIKIWQKSLLLLALLALSLIFLHQNKGESFFTFPKLHYTALPSMLLFSLPCIFLLYFGREAAKRTPALYLSILSLIFLSWLIFFMAKRPIFVDNASRFLYLALLSGFFLLLDSLPNFLLEAKRRIFYFDEGTYFGFLNLASWCFIFIFIGMPALYVAVVTEKSLLQEDYHFVKSSELAAFSWIENNIPSDKTFLRTIEDKAFLKESSAFSLPAFTGRAQFTADYWLARDRERKEFAKKFFAGKFTGYDLRNELRKRQIDYLYLGPEIKGKEREKMKTILEEAELHKLYDKDGIIIYGV